MKYWVIAGVLCASSLVARADDEAENYKITIKDLQGKIKHVEPGPGLEKAHPAPAGWCAGVEKEDSRYRPDRARRTYEQYLSQQDWSDLLAAARYNCVADPRDPVVQQLNGELVQGWINVTGQSEKDAIASIAARMHPDKLLADRTALCKGLAVDEESGGEARDAMTARRAVFGCSGDERTFEAAWSDGHVRVDMLDLLDQSSDGVDEILRLARILDRDRWGDENARLALYGIDVIDYDALDDKKALAQLGQAPYTNNTYAQMMLRESLGRAHLVGREATAKAKEKAAKDAEWKTLLFDAPKQGVDAYRAEAAKFAAEIQRSNDFEKKAFAPSKKAIAGCEPGLRKDLLTVWKTLPHKTAQEAKDSLSDPVASLLFSRYVACMAVDGDPMFAGKIEADMSDIRQGRGERTAAYYAILEALGKIAADRERFPVKPGSMGKVLGDSRMMKFAFEKSTAGKKHDSMGFVGDGGKGVVKSVGKAKDGVLVTFQTAKHQEIGRSCTDTNRIHSIDSSGNIHYYMNCHDTGMITVNDTPEAIVIPTEFADGIKPGVFLRFDASRGHEDDRWGIPYEAYADAKKTKLTNFYGFGF